jgi:hypothetical protein
VLSREDNRIAARALLWAAVAIDPQNFVAHRRLAAALLNAEDLEGAADEYARFIELLLKEHDVHRAAAELAYARSFVGDMPQLQPAADHLVSLGEIADGLESPAQSSKPLLLAEYAATRTSPPFGNGTGRVAPTVSTETTSARAGSHRHRRPWYKRWASEIGIGEYVLAVSLATAATVLVVIAIGGLR